MTILVYLGHPAHFHLFKECMKNLQARSHKVVIVIKSKDVLERLLIDSGLPYVKITNNQTNNAGIKRYTGFFKRLLSLAKISRKHKEIGRAHV